MQTVSELDRLSVTLGGVVPETLWLLADEPEEENDALDEALDEVLALRCLSL